MKDILDEESRKALIAYRMQRAYDTMKEAEVMIRETFYNAAINRMYYACYYATVALLLKNNIQTQTHNGVKTMLGLHFVSTGKLPLRIGKTFTTLLRKDIVEIMMILCFVIRRWLTSCFHKLNCSSNLLMNY